MYFDALTTAAVADELRRTVLGGRVQRIVQVDENSLGFEIFGEGTRFQVLASADPRHPRVLLVDYRVRRGSESPSQLLLLARKRIDGARLVQVEHPPFERTLSLHFGGPEGDATLLVELIERRANLILLQGNQVLEAIQRVGPEMNRYRTVLPGRPYTPPPPQIKLDPTDVTEYRLRQMLTKESPETPVWRALVAGIMGVSPLFARELAFRATGDTQTPVQACKRITPLLDAFQEGLIPYWEHAWRPSVVVAAGGQVTAFASYRLTHQPGMEPMESISAAMSRFYGELLGSNAYQAAKEPLQGAIDRALDRVERRRDSLARQAPSPDKLETLRQKGELILAYSSTIRPDQTELKAQYEVNRPPLVIQLDPQLSPVANAQALFEEYEKGKRALADVPKRLATADAELVFLRQLETDLELASNWPEIDEVSQTLANAGFLPGPQPARPRGSATSPLRVVSADGLVIFAGRNSRQNEIVTFRRAAPNDLWLHVKDAPGGHVVIKSGGRPVPERTLRQAAELAAVYSAARGENEVLVAVVARKRVRRLRGGKAHPGLVTYTGEETLRVRPAPTDTAEN